MFKMNRRLKFLGRGSAFNTNEGNTSAYIKKDDTILLIDCGESIFKTIIDLNLLNGIKNVYILITHFHSDHIGSLSSLLFYCYYQKGIIPQVFTPDNRNFETFAELQGNLLNKTYKFFHIGHMCNSDIPELDIYDIKAYKVKHDEIIKENIDLINGEIVAKSSKNIFPCFGYLIEFSDESLLYYSGDTCEVNNDILNDYLLDDEEDCILFQDTCLKDFKGNVHLSLDKLINAIPREIRHKVYCMHLNDNKLESEAKIHGFNVVQVESNQNTK